MHHIFGSLMITYLTCLCRNPLGDGAADGHGRGSSEGDGRAADGHVGGTPEGDRAAGAASAEGEHVAGDRGDDGPELTPDEVAITHAITRDMANNPF